MSTNPIRNSIQPPSCRTGRVRDAVSAAHAQTDIARTPAPLMGGHARLAAANQEDRHCDLVVSQKLP